MANTNTVGRRIEAGSIWTISDGTTTWTLIAVEPGSISWKPGGYEPIEWKDRGVLQDPLEGDERPTSVNWKMRYTGSTNANDLNKILSTRGSNGLMKQFTIVGKMPNYKGAAAGEQITFAKCFVKPDGRAVQGGVQFDSLNIDMIDNEPEPAVVTY